MPSSASGAAFSATTYHSTQSHFSEAQSVPPINEPGPSNPLEQRALRAVSEGLDISSPLPTPPTSPRQDNPLPQCPPAPKKPRLSLEQQAQAQLRFTALQAGNGARLVEQNRLGDNPFAPQRDTDAASTGSVESSRSTELMSNTETESSTETDNSLSTTSSTETDDLLDTSSFVVSDTSTASQNSTDSATSAYSPATSAAENTPVTILALPSFPKPSQS